MMEHSDATTNSQAKTVAAAGPFKRASITKLRIAGLLANILNQKEETNDVESSTAKVVSDDEEDDSDPYEATIPEIDVLRTFSPLIVHRQVHKSASRRFRAYCQVHFGAVLFADISGFTRLANLLSVEQLQYHISKYFKMLFGCVEKFGGDILKICGDAIMIMWPLAENESKSSLQYRSACALTACLCGRELILSCGLYAAFHGDVEIKLSLHCGVGVADVPCYWVGKSGRWEFLITGDALQQIASTEPEAQSGEIVVSPQVYELVSKHLVGVPTPAGNFLLTSEIKQCNEQEPLVVDDAVLKAFAIDDIDRFDRAPIKSLSDHPTLQFDLNRGIATSYLHMYARANPKSLSMLRENESTGLGLQHYIHNSARLRLRHLGRDFQMAELREVVTLFVNITGLEDDFKNQRLDVIQDIMAAIIDSHKPFGGTLRQFVVDDKGCVAIGALGLPHHTFEDNSARAVEIANIMRGRIQSLGKNCSIGISRGAAFCGLVGSSTRREYAMMGSCVNLAARLMCSCPLGQIVVDERVRASACDVLLFEDMGFVKAKGYADPVSIFAYREALLIPLDLNFLADDDGDTMMVGRKVQLDSLRLSLRDFLEGNPGCSHQFHFIEGEEGIGKTLLVRLVTLDAKQKGVRVISSTGLDSYSQSKYWLVAHVIEQILNIYEEESAAEKPRRASVRGRASLSRPTSSTRSTTVAPPADGTAVEELEEEEEVLSATEEMAASTWKRSKRFKDWVGENLSHSMNPRGVLMKTMVHGRPIMEIVDLIAEVFHEVIPDVNPALKFIKRRERQLLLKTMIVRVLKLAFENRRRMLVIENICRADYASCQALSDFIGSSEIALGIFTFRGSSNDGHYLEHEVFSAIRSNTYPVILQPLKEREVAELAMNVLGPQYRSALNREKLGRIFTRTQGNPGLIKTLMVAFKSELEKGVNPSIEDIRTPGQQSIVKKFDKLEPPLQLLLKTVAAVGSIFSLGALKYVFDALALKNDMVSDGRDVAYVSSTRSGGSRRGSYLFSIKGQPLLVDSEEHSSGNVTGRSVDSSASYHKLPPYQAHFLHAHNNKQRDEMGFGGKLEINVHSLVDLGMFEVAEMKKVKVLEIVVVDSDGKLAVPEKQPGFTNQRSKLQEDTDTPEVGIHALPWVDARGLRRRGWAVISSLKDHSNGISAASVSENEYFRFCHPSIRSTAYALSLEADRVPVHAAIIDYLSINFSRCPGIEETCLHHAMHLNSPDEILMWLMKCAVAARDTRRHSLFVQRVSQLLCLLIKGDLQTSSELDRQVSLGCIELACYKSITSVSPALTVISQLFVTMKSYTANFLIVKALIPAYYPYDFEDRVSPTWNDPDDPETAQWMLTIGCMMRDIMHSFLVVGDFKVMQELDEVSQVLFYGFFKKDCGGEGVDENLDNLSPSSQEIMESKLETVDATTGAPLVSMLDINAVRDLVDDGVLSPRMDKMQKNDVWGQGEQTVETYDVSDINVEMCQLNLDKVDVLSATYLYSYIRGSEATVILDMLRGNAVKAKDTVEGLLVLIDKFCSTDLSVVKVIFLPRLFALLSCCSVSEDKRFANALLIKAEMWLAKAKEERTSDSIRAFYSAAKPSLPGIRHLHVSDSGEWMLMVVVALRLCGEGKWISAIEEFESAINEMKEINDKSLMYQIRLLLCWAFFMIGDITGFHQRIRAVKHYSESVEENLLGCSVSELLSLRFSLSCFYDASEILVSKIKSIRGTGMPIFGMGAGRDSVSVAVAGIFNSKAAIRTESMHNMIGAHASANTIYSKVAEYFLIARFRPKDVSLDDLTDVCENLVSRSPCTYLGGIYLFFAGLSALLVYENYVIQALGGELPSRGKDLNKSIVILEVDDNDLSNLHSTISAITEAVAGEARKNPVLLCFYRALCSRHFRIRGLVDEALQFALFDPNSDSVQVAASVPLGFAFLKMEMALCLLASHDETLPLASKRDNLSEAILIAKESQQLLAKFEAEIEIATLKQCIVDCEDLMRHMLPSFYSSKHNATMSARAYWLDLAGDEDSQDEEER